MREVLMVLRQLLIGASAGGAVALAVLCWNLPTLVPGLSQLSAQFEQADWLPALSPKQGQGEEPSAQLSATTQGLQATTAAEKPAPLLAGLGMAVAAPDEEVTTTQPEGAALDKDSSLFAEVPRSEPSAEVLDPDLYMGALSQQVIIREKPRGSSRVIGYARSGALLRRAPLAAGHQGCAGGWYRVEPDGYICAGNTATLDLEHPILQLASVQPDRSMAMPYLYGRSRYPSPPLYTKVPSQAEQSQIEQDLSNHRAKNFASLWPEAQGSQLPSLLADGARVPLPYGYGKYEEALIRGRALASSSFAFLDLFEADGRAWALTTDLEVVPLDRLTRVSESEFFGEVLNGNADMPVAFVRSQGRFVYQGSIEDKDLKPVRKAGYREAFHLTGQEFKLNGATFLQTKEGEFIKGDERVVRINARGEAPNWAKEGRSWIEVSILKQTLVAYVGAEPVFATMVSTGRDGLADPEESFATVQGMFKIHTKHVTSTMSGDEADDEFDLRDVPYVQYFHEGYAFHAAYWHDSFGQPRSHGCINLSPPDARHLFSLTDPPVPLRWHSALSTKGTLVYIHP